jgi:hypothetical protein
MHLNRSLSRRFLALPVGLILASPDLPADSFRKLKGRGDQGATRSSGRLGHLWHWRGSFKSKSRGNDGGMPEQTH